MEVVATRTRVVGLLVLTVVGGLVASPSADAARGAGLEPGDLVVADQDVGQVLRVPAQGEPEALLSDLESVRGVTVLADGAVLAADSDAGVVVGTGGRYGDETVEVASGLASPEALAVAGPDKVYVTSFSEGTLSRINLDTGQVEALGADIDGPAAVLVLREPRSPAHILVAEWFAGSVGVFRRNGDRSGTLVDGLERPAGLAMAPNGTVYVADRSGDQLVAVNPAGRARVVAELDAPSGLSLEPAVPSTDQGFDLIVSTADGVQRVDPTSGEATVFADLDTAVGVATAPDEFFARGVPADSAAVEGDGGTTGGDVASSGGALDVDPMMLGLALLALVLAGVALVTGVQLIRHRGDDDADESEAAQGSRKDRREARRAEKSLRKAERKSARAELKAQKRSGKGAGPAPEPAEQVAADETPAAALAVTTTADGPSRREQKAAAKRAKADDKAVARADAAQATADAKQAKAAARQAKTAARLAKADAKVAAGADAAQADVDTKEAKSAAKAGAKQAEMDAKAADALAKVVATEADAAAKAAAKADAVQAKADAKQAKIDAKADAKAEKKATKRAPDTEAEGLAEPVGDASTAVVVPPDLTPPAPDEEERSLPDLPPPDLARLPLFAAPAPPPPTAGPFLASLFQDGTTTEPEAEPDPPPASRTPLASALSLGPVIEPTPIEPTAPEPEVVTADQEAEAAPPAGDDLTDLVARPAPPPSGLRGRRRARRRQKVAERRHQHLRAIGEITALPGSPLPEVPPSSTVNPSPWPIAADAPPNPSNGSAGNSPATRATPSEQPT